MHKFIAFIVVIIFCFIPSYIFFAIKYLVEPEGFWQNFAVYGLGMYVFGGVQVGLFILWLFLIIFIICED